MARGGIVGAAYVRISVLHRGMTFSECGQTFLLVNRLGLVVKENSIAVEGNPYFVWMTVGFEH